MKAIVYSEFGPPEVLQVKEVGKPVPRDNEVLIRVCATTVTSADCRTRRGDSLIGRIILGIRKPRKTILGLELAGEIEITGKDVKRFRPGDRVYGFTGFHLGAYAEYICLPENASLAIMPDNLTYEEAASVVDGATTALFFLLDKGNIHQGQNVLIIGASGSIGSYAIQLARYYGAVVTGVCSTSNAAMVKSLGAEKVIDYTSSDFTKNGETYDIIFDTVGKSSFPRCKDSLKEDGRYLVTVMGLAPVLQTLWSGLFGGKKTVFALSISKTEALIFLRELIEAGKIQPVIDRYYPLEQTAEAHRYVENGHKKGNVVITMMG